MTPASAAVVGSGALAVVIAARQEAGRLPSLLADLAVAADRLQEVVVVDGASLDGTPALARLAGARLVHSDPCRGGQFAAGVAVTDAPWLLLLHADARLPADWYGLVSGAMARDGERAWAFRLAIDAPGASLRLVEALVTLRSRWFSLPYGDQGLLVSRQRLEAAGGMRPIPLMEDLDLVLRLRCQGRIGLLDAPLRVSGRRWRRLGVLATAVANARLRRAWRCGIPPAALADRYYGTGWRETSAQGAYQKAQRRCRGSSSHP